MGITLGQGIGAEEALTGESRSAQHPGSPAAPLTAPLTAPRSFRLRVPATSANLGPGYDCMGLALDLHDIIDVVATPRRDGDRPQVTVSVEGEGAATLPRDATHLVVSLIERIMARHGVGMPDLEVRAHNHIPHSRGLGSSAAAVASAVIIADELLPDGLTDEEKLQIGSRVEGHPDNYVPALRGGVALSWQEGDRFHTVPLIPHEELRTVLAVPDVEQSTAEARGVLPEVVLHADAAANSARTGLLVHALTSAPELLLAATCDRLHQEQRRAAFAPSMALVDSLREAGHAAVISGAGPSVLVLAAGDSAARAAWSHIADHAARTDDMWTPAILPISRAGATVEEYPR
ncbi:MULTISPECIES: homoserine kinase [Actinomycetes]|uniref:Homoserine kinase n=2 Tax=Actinomycetes TaxID=1760 RepID=A0ABP6M1M9_9MICC